ncbi:MAG: 50S ribosomal protein L24 [Terriglobia bacterium]
MARMKVKKNDKVLVVAGKEKGKKGKVLQTLPDEGRVIVEGLAMVKRHTKPTQKGPQGGVIDKESPIPVSNVQVVCPSCGNPTRVGKKENADGPNVRVCRKCSGELDKG